MTNAYVLSALSAALLILLSGCGGGGNTPPPFVVTSGTSAVTFEYVEGSSAAPQTVNFTWTGTPPNPVYVGAIVEGTGVNPNISASISETNASALIVARSGLTAGSYTGRILVLVCADSACAQRIGGSPIPISYTVTVRPHVLNDVSARNFSYLIGSATIPTAQLGVDVDSWSATTSAPWLTLSATSGTARGPLVVSIDPSNLTGGSYSGTVTVTAAAGYSQTVNVQLNARVPALLTSSGVLTFNGYTGVAQAAQSLNITTEASSSVAWTATSSVPWVSLRMTGTTPDTVLVQFVGQDTLPANSTGGGLITFSAVVAGTTITRQVGVGYSLLGVTATPTQNSLSFSGLNGTQIASQPIAVNLTNGAGTRPINITASAPWITVDRVSGVTGETFNVGVDPAGAVLASGAHSGNVTFKIHSGIQDLSFSVPVTLTLTRPTLTISTPTADVSAVQLSDDQGRSFQASSLTVRLDAGLNQRQWSLVESDAGNWLSINRRSGTTGVLNDLQLTSVRTGLQPGTYSKQLMFSTQVNGDTITSTLTVTLHLDTHRLIATENGVAFTDTPSFSRLSHHVQIKSNFALPVNWTATADQPWLTVTASGVAGDQLYLDADPAGLPIDALALATVTISPNDASIQPERIRVGLWVGSTTPATQYEVAGTSIRYAWADPVRPLVYVSTTTDIRIFNLYTGQELPPITNVGTYLGGLTVSGDGDTLWVMDGTTRVVAVDLNTRTVLPNSFSAFNTGYSPASIRYTRINGLPMLMNGPGQGRIYFPDGTDLGSIGYWPVAISGDGEKLSYQGLIFDTDYTSARGGEFSMRRNTNLFVLGPFAQSTWGMAANYDGTRVYVADALADFHVYDAVTGTTLTPISTQGSYAVGAAAALDGRFIGIAEYFDYRSTIPNFWVYRPDGSLAQSAIIPGASGAPTISGDGHFAIVGSPTLTVISIAE